MTESASHVSSSPRDSGTFTRWVTVGLVLALALALGTAARRYEPPRPASFRLGGIQVNEPDPEAWVEALRRNGFNTVSVTDYAMQGDWDSANLWFDGATEAEVAEIRAAKEAGLSVVLILRVALDHAFDRNEFLWHGMIQPATEVELAAWFRRYTSFALHWARIARAEGVDVLVIGSELNALTSTASSPEPELPVLHAWYLDAVQRQAETAALLTHRERIEERHLVPRGRQGYPDLASYRQALVVAERAWAEATAPSITALERRRRLLEAHWGTLIGRVREVYDGPLGYAANFDQYREVGFWSLLDVVGINAYFPLRPELTARRGPGALWPRLVEGWDGVLEEIETFRREEGLWQPVLFTEMGYTDRADSTVQPWASRGFTLVPAAGRDEPELVIWEDRPAAPLERALAVRALAAARRERDAGWLTGALYWKLSTVPSHADIEPFVLLLDAPDPLHQALRELSTDLPPAP